MDQPSPYFQNASACLTLINDKDELTQLMEEIQARLHLLQRFHRIEPLSVLSPQRGKLQNLTLYQMALLAAFEYFQETAFVRFTATEIRKRIADMGRDVANITTTLEPLERNGWVTVETKEVNKPKIYTLTKDGQEEAAELQRAAERVANPIHPKPASKSA